MSIGEQRTGDEVDRIVEAWNTQRPDLDFSPLEVLSRVDRLSRLLDRAEALLDHYLPEEKHKGGEGTTVGKSRRDSQDGQVR